MGCGAVVGHAFPAAAPVPRLEARGLPSVRVRPLPHVFRLEPSLGACITSADPAAGRGGALCDPVPGVATQADAAAQAAELAAALAAV
jgi:hypothetical protein